MKTMGQRQSCIFAPFVNFWDFLAEATKIAGKIIR